MFSYLSWMHLAVVDKNVVDACGIAWDLPVGALNQRVLLRPLGKEKSPLGRKFQTPTSFLITLVILRKSSEVMTGPPAAAAFKNDLKNI